MVHNKRAKNCYYCVKQPLFMYTRFFGPDLFRISCSHKNNEKKFKLQDCIVSKSSAILSTFIIFCFTLYFAIQALLSGHQDFYYYSKRFIQLFLGFMIFINAVISVRKLYFRKEQLKSLMNLLQNGKCYGVTNLITYKFMCKSWKLTYVLRTRITLMLMALIIYTSIIFRQINFIECAQKFIMLFGITSFVCVMDNIIIEAIVYREMLNNCYEKLKDILLNHNDYAKIEKVIAINLTKPKCTHLEEQLCKIHRLHTTLYDNLKLYIEFMSLITACNFPVLIGWSILTSYATVHLGFNSYLWQVDLEYCVVLLMTHSCIIYSAVALQCVENLKKPVSHIINN